jgi:hypothetical protein
MEVFLNVQERRLSLGLTKVELQSRARISHDMVEKVDRGYVPANVLIRESIARALDTTPDALWPRA